LSASVALASNKLAEAVPDVAVAVVSAGRTGALFAVTPPPPPPPPDGAGTTGVGVTGAGITGVGVTGAGAATTGRDLTGLLTRVLPPLTTLTVLPTEILFEVIRVPKPDAFILAYPITVEILLPFTILDVLMATDLPASAGETLMATLKRPSVNLEAFALFEAEDVGAPNAEVGATQARLSEPKLSAVVRARA
jgi:hypothetical protein